MKLVLGATAFLATGGDSDNDEQNDNDNEQDKEEEEEAEEGGEAKASPEPEEGKSAAEKPQQQQGVQSRQSRDGEYDAKFAEVPLRTEPIGLDRYHRKYWSLKGGLPPPRSCLGFTV